MTAYRFDGFDGDIKVSLAGLPPGIHAEDSVIPGGQLVTTILLRAGADAEIGKSSPLKVKGVATIAGKEVTKWANPGDNLKFVSVIAPADVLISADRREVVLEPGQDAKITVSVTRKNGFDGRIPVEVLNLPPHTDTPEVGLNSIMITEEKTERTFSIRALPNARPLEQKIYLSGSVETRSPSPSSFASEAILVKIVPKSKGRPAGGVWRGVILDSSSRLGQLRGVMWMPLKSRRPRGRVITGPVCTHDLRDLFRALPAACACVQELEVRGQGSPFFVTRREFRVSTNTVHLL